MPIVLVLSFGRKRHSLYARVAANLARWDLQLPLDDRIQSALMPPAWIGLAQRSISCGRYLARYSGERWSGGTISSPSSSSRLRMGGSSTVSLIALLSLRTIGSGVPFGRKNAFHTLASTPGRPCSPVVARSGMIGARFSAITAIPLTVPSLDCAAPLWMVAHM